jgi:hypothetical protein
MPRSKDKGTAAERMVVEYLKSNYWPYAERRALSGGLDKGDITGTPGLAWEVKSAKTLCIPQWLRETETERINAKADYATLVIKPAGVGKKKVGAFYALMDLDQFTRLAFFTFGSFRPEGVNTFNTSIRKMKLDVAIGIAGSSPDEASTFWVNYPTFAVTSLEQMAMILFKAGYGSAA